SCRPRRRTAASPDGLRLTGPLWRDFLFHPGARHPMVVLSAACWLFCHSGLSRLRSTPLCIVSNPRMGNTCSITSAVADLDGRWNESLDRAELGVWIGLQLR